MTDNASVGKSTDNSIIIRVPKPNIQVIVLILLAFITLFQTVQLKGISTTEGSTPSKTAPATTSAGTAGSESEADVPQSVVGGC